MQILLTRHGQTEWNVLKKVQGKVDIELNATGIKQAEETALKLKNTAIDIIISSPLKRARQTAEIINKETNLPIIIDERISERDFGEFEGMSTMDFDFNAFWSYKQNNKYNKAENIRVFFKRVYDFLDDIKSKSRYDTGVEVSTADSILTLSTCDYSRRDGRFVVQAKLVENP